MQPRSRPTPNKSFAPAPQRRSADAPRRAGMLSAIPAAQKQAFLQKLLDDCAQIELALTESQNAQLLRFLDHLLKWNALINISAVTEPEDMLSVHIVDSLAALSVLSRFASPGVRVLDVGTGPGLPATPWAIALPAAQLHAIDAVRKKIDTIHDFIAQEKLSNLTAQHTRIEALRGEYEVVTSRAFSSLKTFVTLAGPRLRGGGAMLALKGKTPQDEIAELNGTGFVVEDVVTLQVPRLSAERCVVVLRRKSTP